MNEKTIESLIKFNSPEMEKIYKQDNNFAKKRMEQLTKINDDLKNFTKIVTLYCFSFTIYYALYSEKGTEKTSQNEQFYDFLVWDHYEKDLFYNVYCVRKILIKKYDKQIYIKLSSSTKVIELKVTKRIEIFKYVPAFFEYIHSKEINEHNEYINKPYILAKHPDFKGDMPEDIAQRLFLNSREIIESQR